MTKRNSSVREYDVLTHTGTARNVITGEIVPIRTLQESGYVITCKYLFLGDDEN